MASRLKKCSDTYVSKLLKIFLAFFLTPMDTKIKQNSDSPNLMICEDCPSNKMIIIILLIYASWQKTVNMN